MPNTLMNMPGKKLKASLKPLFVLVVSFVFSLSSLYSQDSLSLNECIDIAIENNLQFRLQKLDQDQAALNLKRDRFSMLPNLNLSAGQGYNIGRTIDPFTNTFVDRTLRSNSFSLNSRLNIFQGFNTQNTIKSSQYSLRASFSGTEASRNDLILQTANLYLQILLSYEQIEAAKSRLQTSRSLVKQNKTLVESGQSNKADLLEVEAQMANDKAALIESENQLSLAKLQLQQFLNLKYQDEFAVQKIGFSDDAEIPERNQLEQIVNENLNRLPQIDQADLNLQSADYAYKAAKGIYYPTLSVSASLNSGYSSQRQEPTGGNIITDTVGFVLNSSSPVINQRFIPEFNTVPFDDQLVNNFGQIISINLNIPLFNRYQTTHSVQSAKINQQRAEINRDQQIQTVRNDIYEAYVNMENAFNRLEAAGNSLKSQKLLFEQNDLRYNAGLLSFYDWQNSRNTLRTAENDYIRAKYNFHLNKMIFDFYRGQQLSIEEK